VKDGEACRRVAHSGNHSPSCGDTTLSDITRRGFAKLAGLAALQPTIATTRIPHNNQTLSLYRAIPSRRLCPATVAEDPSDKE